MKVFWLVLMITPLHFCQISLSNVTSKAGNYAAPRGSTVWMSCIPPGVLIDESKFQGGRSFVWTDELGKEIVNPRVQMHQNGQLQMSRARDEDSGIYHCKFRPPEAFKHNGALSKIYIHKLIVYELSGHKFETLVAFDITKYGSEAAITSLRDLMKQKICGTQLCSPGAVTSEKCEVNDNEAQMCEMSMMYEATEPPTTAECNEACVREIVVARLKKAQKLLEAELLRLSEDPQARLKPDMQSINTKHIITCKVGYHLIESNYEHCYTGILKDIKAGIASIFKG